MTYPVLSIANKILHYGASPQNDEELISNLKLQKLLYYVQGFHLAVFNEPLFDEEIEAWMYGPVVPTVYEYFQNNGNKGIEPTGEILILPDEVEQLFDEVMHVFGQYSAIGLMNLTHNEMPWKNTPEGKGHIISKDKMKQYFKTRLS